jgi:hypothetical protein
MTHTERETLKLALNALKSAAAELYKASSYCNTYEVLGNTNDAITEIQKYLAAQPAVQEPTDGQVKELADRYGLDTSMLGALRNFADAYHASTTPPAAPVQPIGEVIGRHEYAGLGQIKHVKTIEWFGEPAPVGTKLYTTPHAQLAPEQYTALEQALTRLQKRYAELEAKVAAQPKEEDLYDLALKADNGGQP